jgi:hypothetical protein
MPAEREILARGFQLTLGSSLVALEKNFAVLGVGVSFATRVRSVPLGAIALERLSEADVNLSRVMKTTGVTETVVAVMLPHGRDRHISSLFLQSGQLSRAFELFRCLK